MLRRKQKLIKNFTFLYRWYYSKIKVSFVALFNCFIQCTLSRINQASVVLLAEHHLKVQ